MENSVFTTDTILSRKEQVEFQKSGFYVKELFGVKELTQIFFNFLGPLFIAVSGSLVIIVAFSISQVFLTFALLLVIPVGFFMRNILFYVFLGKLFCTNTGIYSINTKKKFSSGSRYIHKAIRSQSRKYIPSTGFDDLFTKIIVFLFLAVFVGLLQYLLDLGSWYLVSIFFGILITIGLSYGLIYGLRQFVERTQPLYIFGNMGIRTQKMIREIEDMSIQIQIENREITHYETFDTCYQKSQKNYTDILRDIESMEKIKHKIRPSNLFSAERFYSSLRFDGVNAFIEIKKFIEMKRSQLTDMQSGQIRSETTLSEEGKSEIENGIKKLSINIDQFDLLIKGII